MYRRKLNRIILVVAGLLLVVCVGVAQDPTNLTDDPASSLGVIGEINGPGADFSVCPSLDKDKDGSIEVSSTDIFQVGAYHENIMGDEGLNEFEWFVYGGWIVSVEGDVEDVVNTYDDGYRTEDGGIRCASVTITGVANPGDAANEWISSIEVEWDTTNYYSTESGWEPVKGWVAVRQSSQWGCTDGEWSVFKNDIINEPPEFTWTPSNITLPGSYSENNYTLPVPGASDDGCNTDLTYTYTVLLPDETELTNDDLNNEVQLQVGENEVTWVVSDGYHSIEHTYTITVDPEFQIENVAWINPYCNADNGKLQVSETNVGDLKEDITVIYRLEEDETPIEDNAIGTFEGLPQGNYDIYADVTYAVNDGNIDEDVTYKTGPYSISLSSTAHTSVEEATTWPLADITDAGCKTTDDGKIEVDLTAVGENNYSVDFDGIDDHLFLKNKFYNNETSLETFSIATWIKAEDAPGTLISFDNSFYQLVLTYATGSQTTRVRFQTGSEDGIFTHNTKINDGEWHLVVATFDQGNRTIYIDGEKEEYTAGTSTLTAIESEDVRYGMIGARSQTSDPGEPLSSTDYFKGQMAEMALWNGTALTDAHVQTILKYGMSGLTPAPTDQWVLNSVPTELSTQDEIFSDLGNSITFSAYNWARFYGAPGVVQDVPKLVHWTNSSGDDLNVSTTTIEGLGVGDYTLHVKDVLGCGEETNEYKIENSDDSPPELYWNAAVLKEEFRTVEARHWNSSEEQLAEYAVDGYSDSYSATEISDQPWWQVDLGGVVPIRMVNVYPANNFGSFYVIASLTPFEEGSSLSQDLNKDGVTAVEYTGTNDGTTAMPVRIVSDNVRYVRIRVDDELSLQLREVEVLSNRSEVPDRILNLSASTDDPTCVYSVTDNDLSIAPFDYDNCGELQTLQHDQDNGFPYNLEGYDFQLEEKKIEWTATDDFPLTSTLTIQYKVVDKTPPVFDPSPFDNLDTPISYCEAEEFTLPVPKIYDNYPLTCDGSPTPYQSIELYNGSNLIYSFTDLENYDPNENYETDILFEDLNVGANRLEWRVVDFSGNKTSEFFDLHVQREPRVIEVSVSPITCTGSDNSQITFSRIFGEHQIDESEDVTYVLSYTLPDAEPYNEYHRQINDSVFNNVPVNAEGYYAYIIVNECLSDVYYDRLIIEAPDAIVLTPEVTPVACSGFEDGAIELFVQGGSQTNVLHFWGDDNSGATANHYTALNLNGEGTIEGWFFLDSLGGAVDEINFNIGLFGVSGNYGIRIFNEELIFFVETDGATFELSSGAISERQWTHVSAGWSATGGYMNLLIDGAVVASRNDIDESFEALTNGTDVYMATGLQGFVRNIRIWNRALSSDEIIRNQNMSFPIDVGANVVANYLINAGGAATTLQNRALVAGVQNATVNTSADWQRFAYHWENSDGEVVARTKDIANVVADDYSVWVYDPLGCPAIIEPNIEIPIDDNLSPVLTFSNIGYGGTPLDPGEAIWRFTPEGECIFYPQADYYDNDLEENRTAFDPVVYDHGCPPEDVTVTFEIIEGAFGISDPAYDPTGKSSLADAPMTDIITLRWTAVDQVPNPPTVVEVDYYIIDNQMPEAADFHGLGTVEAPIMLPTDEDFCSYRVEDDAANGKHPLLGMFFDDNCYSGELTNNLTGINTLEGHVFGKGPHTIRWTYVDKTFPGGHYAPTPITVEQYIEVYDDQLPDMDCVASLTVELDGDGSHVLDPLSLNSNSSDNCNALSYSLATYDALNDTYTPFTEFACEHLGENTIYLEATDGAGLISRCPVTVTVEDNVAPVVQVQTDPIPLIALGNTPEAAADEAIVTALMLIDEDNTSDNCTLFDDLTFEIRKIDTAPWANEISLNCDNIADGIVTVQVRVSDGQTNSTVRDAYLIIDDNTDPEPDCKGTALEPFEIALDSRGIFDLDPAYLDNGSSDNCAIAYFEIPEAYQRLNCNHLSLTAGIHEIPLTVYDMAGNDATCTAFVNVIDETDPRIIAPDYILTFDDEDGYADLSAFDIGGESTDNCTASENMTYEIWDWEANQWVASKRFDCGYLNGFDPEEDYTIRLRVTDESDNSSEQDVNVTVRTGLNINQIVLSECGDNPFTAGIQGGREPYSYQWTGYRRVGGVFQPYTLFRVCRGTFLGFCTGWDTYQTYNGETPMLNGNPPSGVYRADLRVTDQNDCTVFLSYEFNWEGGLSDEDYVTNDVVCSEAKNVRYNAVNLMSRPGLILSGDPSFSWVRPDASEYAAMRGGQNGTGAESRYIEFDFLEGEYELEFSYTVTYRMRFLIWTWTCTETYIYTINVRPPIEPEFVNTYDRIICPYSQKEYELIVPDPPFPADYPEDEWIRYEWNYSQLSADASNYDGGFLNSTNVEIQWGDHGTQGRVGVKVTDRRGCESEIVYTDEVSVIDSDPPTITTCPANVTRNTAPQQCSYTFGGAELPRLTIDDVDDVCLNDQNRHLYSIIPTRNDGEAYTNRNYPEGHTAVTWTVTDRGGNQASCEQHIFVVDRQDPIFIPLDDIELLTLDNDCEVEFPADTRIAQASDNCGSGNITYELYTDFGLTGTDLIQEGYTNDPAGITFPLGLTKVTVVAYDDAVEWIYNETTEVWESSPLPNSSSTSFLVTVIDNTPPVVAPLDDLDFYILPNFEGLCAADVWNDITPPGVDEITDNCTSDFDNFTVEFYSRSDFRARNEAYPVGTTTITWRVADESGNETFATQNIIVHDNQPPWFDAGDPALQNVSITYCNRANHRLPTPAPLDNCTGTVESISWSIVGDSYNESGIITRAEYPNFRPNGGFTDLLPSLPSDPVTGSDYTVTWTALDNAGNNSDDEVEGVVATYTYNLRVEIKPEITGEVLIGELTCGNSNDGKIDIPLSALHYEAGASLEYSIDNGASYQPSNLFEDLAAGEYSVRIRANGCESEAVTASIPEKIAYDMNLLYDASDIECWEDETAVIRVKMTGGEPGQILFNGNTLTAAHYDGLNTITATGAIEAWVYAENANLDGSLVDALLVEKSGAYALRIINGKFTIQVGDVHLEYPVESNIVPAAERWYHVSGTWDANSNTMQVFINGEEQSGGVLQQGATTVSEFDAAAANTNPINFGSSEFTGILREVRIWSAVVPGTIPGETLTASANPALVAYWRMQDGDSETEAQNSVPGGTNILSVSGWITDYPQPGKYSWRKAVAPPYVVWNNFSATPEGYGNAIHLDELGRGRYQLSFTDQYGCPEAPGLLRTATFVPTDSESPVIENIGNPEVDITTDCETSYCDNCSYTVQSADDLWPAITDDCDFESTWRIIPSETLIPQVYTTQNGATDALWAEGTGVVLYLGENRVEVTATQNEGDVSATAIYTITLNDKIKPEADGLDVVTANLSPHGNVPGSGIVYYDAAGFDENSRDNCTDPGQLRFEISRDGGSTWEEELEFDCDDVGAELSIMFKAIDEAGNEAIVDYTGETQMVVQDIDLPDFLFDEDEYRYYEECVTVDDVSGEDIEIPYVVIDFGKLVLDENDYIDNCTVVNWDFALHYLDDSDVGTYVDFEGFPEDNDPDPKPEPAEFDWKGRDAGGSYKFYEGETEVEFRVVDKSGNYRDHVVYKVTVLPKPEPQSPIQTY